MLPLETHRLKSKILFKQLVDADQFFVSRSRFPKFGDDVPVVFYSLIDPSVLSSDAKLHSSRLYYAAHCWGLKERSASGSIDGLVYVLCTIHFTTRVARALSSIFSYLCIKSVTSRFHSPFTCFLWHWIVWQYEHAVEEGEGKDDGDRE